ncbi:hypothetical protein HD554DRAFT_2166737 [Boletus coccyginus]|nr:hypothetical protein HD554DRAFT_2166737 [Boletus coccyginus]
MPKTRTHIELLEENLTRLHNEFLKKREVIRHKEKLAKGNRMGSTSMIPKPKGRSGCAGLDSYNVMNAMKLSKDQYNLVVHGIRTLVAKYLDITLPISKQSNKLMIEKVIIMAQTKFPILKNYKGSWATHDIMAQYLCNRSSRECQVTQVAKILFPAKNFKRKAEEMEEEEEEEEEEENHDMELKSGSWLTKRARKMVVNEPELESGEDQEVDSENEPVCHEADPRKLFWESDDGDNTKLPIEESDSKFNDPVTIKQAKSAPSKTKQPIEESDKPVTTKQAKLVPSKMKLPIKESDSEFDDPVTTKQAKLVPSKTKRPIKESDKPVTTKQVKSAPLKTK